MLSLICSQPSRYHEVSDLVVFVLTLDVNFSSGGYPLRELDVSVNRYDEREEILRPEEGQQHTRSNRKLQESGDYIAHYETEILLYSFLGLVHRKYMRPSALLAELSAFK